MLMYVLMGVLSVWVLLVSFFLFGIKRHYDKLIKTTGKERIDDILETILTQGASTKNEVKMIRKEIEILKEQSVHVFQKVGFKRFSAFEKSMGEQSFVIAMLDGKDNGIVINFIYTHDGLRAYAKKVTGAKGVEHVLSKEEETAVKEAHGHS